jgi:hypothetical protein
MLYTTGCTWPYIHQAAGQTCLLLDNIPCNALHADVRLCMRCVLLLLARSCPFTLLCERRTTWILQTWTKHKLL